MPGAFKLDHLQPIEAILFQKIFNFFSFILGGQFLLPQRTNNGNGDSSNFKIDWSESATFSEQSLSSVCVNVEMSEDLVLRRLPNIT